MEIVEKELRGCFDYFWNESNHEEGSLGYGIVRDSTDEKQKDFGSIAATGFGLAGYAIGVEKGYVSYEEAYKRSLLTLKTFYQMENINGFFYHFVHLKDGKRYGKCEASVVDTSLFLAGAIVVAEYFKGEIKDIFEKIYERIDWDWYVWKEKNQFHMGYFPEMGGFTEAKWDHYAEQFLMYVLSAASKTHPLDGKIFYDFERWHCKYKDYEYIRSGPNAIFVYQFSHAFLDFRNTKDKDGVDWFLNSVNATYAHRQYCIDNEENSKTYSDVSFGLSACHYKKGYTGGFGAKPFGHRIEAKKNDNDGTIPLYGAIGSIAFTPEISIKAMEHYYTFKELWGKYGFKESYNLDEEPPYFDDLYLGIDKGISMLQIANYENEFVWKYFMKNEYIIDGCNKIGISKH